MNRSPQKPAALVTGGLGYVGSHVVVALADAGYRVVIVDNLSNSSIEVLERIERLCDTSPATYCGDVRDLPMLKTVLQRNPVQCALHLAGLKAVAPSVDTPLDYYDVNVNGTMTLLRALKESGVRRLVFGSSATVYGDATRQPLAEDAETVPACPFARSKRAAEDVLSDLCRADPEWGVIALRYFNPAGAHPSGVLGERGEGAADNLLPTIARVAAGRRDVVHIHGADYSTPDGTGVRDYVHVADLAEAHVRAVERLMQSRGGFDVINLGTGRGHSVLDVLRAYEAALGAPIPFDPAPRRKGDVGACVADVARAEALLGWRARRDLDAICRDAVQFAALEEEQRALRTHRDRTLRTPPPREWQEVRVV